MLVLQSDAFNRSRLRTVVGIIVSSNLGLLDAPGNVLLPKKTSGLPRDSVANVSQWVTVDKDYLDGRVGRLPPRTLSQVEAGLRFLLDP